MEGQEGGWMDEPEKDGGGALLFRLAVTGSLRGVCGRGRGTDRGGKVDS